MNPNFRALLLSAMLLVTFLAVALLLQGWLQRRAAGARGDAAQGAAERLSAALALNPRAPAAWDDAYRAQLGRAFGGPITLGDVRNAETAAIADDAGDLIQVSVELPGHAGWQVRGQLPTPPLVRLQLAYQRAIGALVLFGVLLALVPLLPMVFSRRESSTRPPWKTEAAGLEQFARLTVERGAALELEHGARVRAEEDLQLSRSLLDRSLEERIRLGRELHDNISQTLYAVTLTLESVRKGAALPPTAEQRLEQSMQELRRLNREVRAYIRDLEPDAVMGESFAVALSSMLAAVAPGVSIEQRVQEDVLRRVPAQQAAELINVVREAVSNSVRHGQATHIAVRAAQDAGRLALVVTDNGQGFSAQTRSTGHGLANMRARAAALGGELSVESAPGKGARVVLTLPLQSEDA